MSEASQVSAETVAMVLEAMREAQESSGSPRQPAPPISFLDKVRADPNYPYRETILREAAEKEEGK